MEAITIPVSQEFHDALAYASVMHAGQVRKQTTIPYVAHLMAVSSIVWEAGGSETEAIAALLHDGPEDQGGVDRLAAIRRRFGDEVADIVEHCSDTFEMPKPSWAERKAAYVERLKKADRSTLLVSVADKLHNARATLRDLSEADDPSSVWGRFRKTREQTLANYLALIGVYIEGASDPRRGPLVAELYRTVDAMEKK